MCGLRASKLNTSHSKTSKIQACNALKGYSKSWRVRFNSAQSQRNNPIPKRVESSCPIIPGPSGAFLHLNSLASRGMAIQYRALKPCKCHRINPGISGEVCKTEGPPSDFISATTTGIPRAVPVHLVLRFCKGVATSILDIT